MQGIQNAKWRFPGGDAEPLTLRIYGAFRTPYKVVTPALKLDFDQEGLFDEVAVGTIIADRPPHRSARALVSACGSYLG